jgi:hypothetical protein
VRFRRKTGLHCAQPIEEFVDRIPNRADVTADELASLRLIVDSSFVSTGTIPGPRRARLLQLGLIQNGMGGLMPTPAGRIVARM